MTSIAVVLWTFLEHLASRVGLLESFEVASAVLVVGLVAVLASFAHRRPSLGLHLDDRREPVAPPTAAAPPAVARRTLRHPWRAIRSPALR